MRKVRRREKVARDRIELVRESEGTSHVREPTRRQRGTVRQSKGHDRKGMRREERLKTRQVRELDEQARAPRVGDKRRRGYESRDTSRTRKSSCQKGQRLRGGER